MDDNEREDIELSRKEQRIIKEKKSNEKWEKLGRWFASRGAQPNNAATHNKNNARPERTKKEYVFLGRFPQTIKPKSVDITYSVGDGLYMGSDGNTYCKREYDKRSKKYNSCTFDYAFASDIAVSEITRYSDGQNCSSEDYFRVEPIKWYVIKREDGILTLISDRILFNAVYNKYNSLSLLSGGGKETWVKSDIRSILNDSFYYTAFSYGERSSIVSSTLAVDKDNLLFLGKTFSDSTTTDNVFMLGYDECKQYGLNSVDLAKTKTDFCGMSMSYEKGSLVERHSLWMTRSVCNTFIDEFNNITYVRAKYITQNGCPEHHYKDNSTEPMGVVPVIRVNESAVTVYGADGQIANQSERSDYRDVKSTGAEDSNGAGEIGGSTESSTEQPAPPREPTKKDRIKYTILAPICMIAGGLIAYIIRAILFNGGISGTLPSLLAVAYMTFSIVMVWKVEKNLNLIKTLAILNIVVSCLCWGILGH